MDRFVSGATTVLLETELLCPHTRTMGHVVTLMNAGRGLIELIPSFATIPLRVSLPFESDICPTSRKNVLERSITNPAIRNLS